MDILQAIRERHSVRNYIRRPIEESLREALLREIAECNAESGLNIQLITDEPEAFGSFTAHYGMFRGVENYIAIVGKSADADLSEKAGWYGERVVLKAQMLGLNTCWVAATYSKRKNRCTVAEDEKVVCVIALGYGKTQGKPHKNKPMDKLCKVDGEMPEWFRKGMEAAMLAPTAINQQKFRFVLTSDGKVLAEDTHGPYSSLDLGIVKYHFEQGAGKKIF